MSKPIRVQRKRTKGYRLPENTISVTRPGRWGNPLKLENGILYVNAAYRRKWFGSWVVLAENADMPQMLSLFRDIVSGCQFDNPDLQHWAQHFKKLDITELRGKHLACYCKPESACHASVLLELANP